MFLIVKEHYSCWVSATHSQ